MKKNKLSILMGFILTSSAFKASALSYPEEFHDFFVETPQSIEVTIAGERAGESILASVSYDRFTINSNSNSLELLASFLQEKGVKEEFIDSILSDVNIGIETDAECTGRLSQCLLQAYDSKVRYVFDFDNSRLKIFLPIEAIREDLFEVSYEEPLNNHPALVNWTSLYGFTNLDGSDNYTWNNETTLGLPLGYVSLDTEMSSGEDSFEVHTATYDVEYKSTRFQIGKNRYNPLFNTTDYFNSNADYRGSAVSVASSSNLMKKDRASYQQIHFYAPQNGKLEIYRGDRLIFSKVVSEGKQAISYESLPKGTYEIKMTLNVAGQSVFSETRQIVNNNNYALKVGNWDYALTFGEFEEKEDYEGAESRHYANFDRGYIRGMFNYRLLENLQLGGGVTSSSSEQYYQVGSKIDFDNVDAEYIGGVFSSDSYYHAINLSMGPLYIDYRKLQLSNQHNNDYQLANQIYGDYGFYDFGLGISAPIFNGFGYARVSKYVSDQYDLLFMNNYEYRMISGGWSYNLPRGSLNLSVDYIDSNTQDDELRTMLTYRLDLGSGVSSQMTVYGDKDGFDNNANYLTLNKRFNDWQSSTSLGAKINRDNTIQSELSSSVYGNNDYLNANAYGFFNDSGHKSVSVGVSGTQVISTNGIQFSNEKARSFANVVQHYSGTQAEKPPKLQLSVQKNGKLARRTQLSKQQSMIKLDDYDDLRFDIDKGGYNIEIENNTLNAYSLPGSLYTLHSTIFNALSKTVVLDDIDGNPIDSLQCVGSGCISVEPLSNDGVYRVNYRENGDFQLVSRKGLCVVERDSDKAFNQGYCLPGLDLVLDGKWESTAKLLEDMVETDVLVYLGRFDSGDIARGVIEKLAKLNIMHKTIDIDGGVYIYLSDGQQFSTVQKELLQELDAYVLHRDTEIDLFTIKTDEASVTNDI
ncbi:TcfC E-set like domain-containing protein [Vibrio vulnificus]|nr:TcfC E-set like domain-containing protein [Vibrio vulnificus]